MTRCACSYCKQWYAKIEAKIKELEPEADEYTCRCFCTNPSKVTIEVLKEFLQ
jgi:hypothetical protein